MNGAGRVLPWPFPQVHCRNAVLRGRVRCGNTPARRPAADNPYRTGTWPHNAQSYSHDKSLRRGAAVGENVLAARSYSLTADPCRKKPTAMGLEWWPGPQPIKGLATSAGELSDCDRPPCPPGCRASSEARPVGVL